MPDLSPTAHAVIERAHAVAVGVLDELSGRLVVGSGGLGTQAGLTAKHDGTPVTELDRVVDELLATRLTDAFPGHGVLSEEGTTIAPTTSWTWVVDPIDGTSNFTCGLPYWCVSVALLLDGTPVLGLIDAPAIGRRYLAIAGAGAHLERRTVGSDAAGPGLGSSGASTRTPMHVRAPVDWRRAGNGHIPVMLTKGTARRARDAGLKLNARVMGSTALDLAMVAEGVAAASIAVVPKVWDVAAGMLLVREAGGVTLEVGAGVPLLPLRAGVEHRDHSSPVAAGSDDAELHALATALLPS